ncbi:helix-turn-helix transcriptional regulator [Mucilaginibacter pedocola]|uniref:Transcriptional regulator n=1 Tax=Mucilaginibacter pedocola TaxID=1792845 RepID=A0A1S9PFX3_9SPHI|nr:helix-turn-helix transcriptional regulator [Mucilaginibacter pedocola]OOQ59851.1 transcriptional regulator [Mucilaginibacter pedocola]
MKNTLKVQRAKANITQDDLAKILNVSRQTIYSIEKNVYVPSTVIALKLADYFDVKVEDLFSLEDSD